MSVFKKDAEARLLELLKEETGMFGQMLKLTEEQAELIASDDVEAFEKSLDHRQELIEKINGLHKESEVLMQSYITYANTPAGKRIDGIEAAAEELRDVIAKCAGLNEKNAEAAKDKVDSYKERIGKLNTGRKSLGLYIQNVSNDPEMFDKMT